MTHGHRELGGDWLWEGVGGAGDSTGEKLGQLY